MRFKKIIESKKVLEYLEIHFLVNQYKKSKNNILSWNVWKTFFKERNPPWSGIWYFRINKKYRALWFIENNELRIYDIDNHQ